MRSHVPRPVLHADCPRAGLRRALPGLKFRPGSGGAGDLPSCQVVRERDFRQVGTRVLDLSSRGMLVETDLPVLTGESLVVSFQSPSGRWHDLDGSVARVLHGRRRGDRHRAVGITFEIDPFNELLLCEALRRMPVTERHLVSQGLRHRN